MPLTFEGTRAIGASLGSGVVMVFDERADLRGRRPAHRRLLPRRVLRPVRALPRRHRAPGGARHADRRRTAARLDRSRRSRSSTTWRRAMRDASICGLGQTASGAIQSAIAQARRLRQRNASIPRTGASDRTRPVELTIDGDARHRARGHDDPRGLPRAEASTRRRSASSRT